MSNQNEIVIEFDGIPGVTVTTEVPEGQSRIGTMKSTLKRLERQDKKGNNQ